MVSVEGGCKPSFNISLLDQDKWVNQNANRHSVEIDKLFLKFIEKCKGSRTTKTMLRKKNKVYGISALKIYYNTTVIETLCYIRIDK